MGVDHAWIALKHDPATRHIPVTRNFGDDNRRAEWRWAMTSLQKPWVRRLTKRLGRFTIPWIEA